MSQFIITGKPRFEDIIELIKLLPVSDRIALKNYLQDMDDPNHQEIFDQILARFRIHNFNNDEIKKDVENALKEVRGLNQEND
jgi:hypothetical protein